MGAEMRKIRLVAPLTDWQPTFVASSRSPGLAGTVAELWVDVEPEQDGVA
jgi:hypothetical protein